MTPDEAARAEAESIATRWVPAHMTARQGMVDDIAAALVTGRRLVEEAQDKTDAANTELDNTLAEVDRLKGELAEARRLLMTAPLNVHADSLLAWMKARTRHLAAPPAEQARVVSWKVELDEAEQAQGEGAKACECKSAKGPLCAFCQGSADNDDRSSMWPTIHGLEQHYREVRGKVAELAKRMEAIEDRMDKQEAIGGPNWSVGREAEHFVTGRGCEPAPPPSEAAGPGHVFECICAGLSMCPNAHRCQCVHCPRPRSDHAVPPIPEGT